MRRQPSNRLLLETVIALKKKGRKEKVAIWEKTAGYLLKPRRQRVEINLSQISRSTKANDIVVIPGKVLANGVLAHKVTVAALRFSGSAIKRIEQAGGKALSLIEAVEKHPRGSKVKLLR